MASGCAVFFNAVASLLVALRGATATPSAYALGCGRRVAVALWGEGTQRGLDAETDASGTFAVTSAGR